MTKRIMLIVFLITGCDAFGPLPPIKQEVEGQALVLGDLPINPKNIQFWFDTSELPFILDTNGRTYQLNLVASEVSEVISVSQDLLLDQSYSFPNREIIAFDDDEILMTNPSESFLERWQKDAGPNEGSTVGAAPGFLVIQGEQDRRIFFLDDGRLEVILEADRHFHSVGKCQSGCLWWAVQDRTIFTKASPTQPWQASGIQILAPELQTIVKVALFMTLNENGQMSSPKGIGLDESGQFFAWGLVTNADPAPMDPWEEIASIQGRVCQPCHESDGFELPETWQTKLSVMEKRLSQESGPGAMPPAGSRFAADLSDEEREKLLQWLKALSQQD